jgi:hypothetical protein
MMVDLKESSTWFDEVSIDWTCAQLGNVLIMAENGKQANI